jgi:hypothetical protein
MPADGLLITDFHGNPAANRQNFKKKERNARALRPAKFAASSIVYREATCSEAARRR